MVQDVGVTLGQVVAGRLLKVADYQRPYAWESKQLADFWNDLDLMGTGVHYTGTLVLLQREDPGVVTSDGDRLETYEVVDGQQRLTTCLIALDAVRRALGALGEDDQARRASERLRDDFSVVKINGVEVPRLELGTDLNELWTRSVLGGEPAATTTLIAGAQRLLKSRAFFDSQVANLVDGQSPDESVRRLLELRGRVVSGLRFLIYEVDTTSEVGVIFETLNERGRGLSELEKVKNYLLFLARQFPDDRREEVAGRINGAWSRIFERLSSQKQTQNLEERLLRAHWLTTQDPDSRRWKGVVSIKDRFPRSKFVPGSATLGGLQTNTKLETPDGDDVLWDELRTELTDYISSLEACSTYLVEVYDPQAEFVDFGTDESRTQSRTLSAALRRSSVVALFLPLLFASRLSRPTSGADYVRMLELCEKYSARVFAIAARRANAGEPYLCKAAHALHTSNDVEKCLETVRAQLWNYAPDSEVEQHLTEPSNWYAYQSHKFILYEYEISKATSASDVKPWSEFVDTGKRKTTEHILPQHPKEDSQWEKAFSKEHRELYTHTLGNLVLTYDNSVYSNHEFSAKRGSLAETRACYFRASLASEREVAEWEEWTPESVEERQARIAAWAMERWGIERPRDAALDAAEDALGDEMETLSRVEDGADVGSA